MEKFPRVFELLGTSQPLSMSDFEENNNQNGTEYVREIRAWLKTLPYYKLGLKPVDLTRLSGDAIQHAQKAIHEAVRTFTHSNHFFSFIL